MTRFAGQDVEPVSDDEVQRCLSGKHEITGFAAYNSGQWLFLKCAFRTDDISTVALPPALAAALFWYLKNILGDRDESDGTPMKWAVAEERRSEGHIFPPLAGAD